MRDVEPVTGVGGGSHRKRLGDPVLTASDLSVEFRTPHGVVRVIEDVGFELRAGQTFGLVGESGSGKSVTSLAVLGMIAPPVGRVATGSVKLEGRELRTLSHRDMTRVRGREIAMIFQEPRRSLNPAFTVGDQIAETVRRHLSASRKDAWKRAVEMLDLVGIPQPEKRAKNYPHEFSGGMAQRAMLAIALSCSPKVLIADEPTTALDVTVQAKVLNLMRDLQKEFGLAVLFISHDLGVIAEMCDTVAVMYAGQIVEQADADELFFHPKHPYSAALLESIPQVSDDKTMIRAISGVVPPAHAWPSGCRFHPRCQHAVAECRTETPQYVLGETQARCWRVDQLKLGGVQ